MKSYLYGLLTATVLLLVFGVIYYRQSSGAVPTVTATPARAESFNGPLVPVVVELFTSEGCSSCPPADVLLTQLDQMPPRLGLEIIALSEHVDYWNYIGWADPFSSAAYSARQQAYAQAFNLTGGRGDVYTPQMVVDGQFEFVGSNAASAREAIAKAAAFQKAQVSLTLEKTEIPHTLQLRIEARQLPQLHANDQAEVLFALTENNVASNVTRGENSGRKLRHSAVTRELRLLGQFPPGQKSFQATTSVKLVDGWNRSALRAVAFIQERTHRRILGAASLKLN